MSTGRTNHTEFATAPRKAATLRAILDTPRNGMNQAYRHSPFYSFVYSDGAKELTDAAASYWLLDILATEVAPIYRKQFNNVGTGYVEMVVTGNSAVVRFTMSDKGSAVWTRQIDHTDFPEGIWSPLFEIGPYGENTTIAILPSEH